MDKKKTPLTLGTCLSSLYLLSRPYFKNQVAFFKALFQAFHRNMSDLQNLDYESSQARVSQIMRGRELLPRDACILYMGPGGDEALKNDVDSYLSIATVSHKQKALHQQALLDLINNSNNLNPLDKNYILASTVNENTEQLLRELLFRMLYILIREPLPAPA